MSNENKDNNIEKDIEKLNNENVLEETTQEDKPAKESVAKKPTKPRAPRKPKEPSDKKEGEVKSSTKTTKAKKEDSTTKNTTTDKDVKPKKTTTRKKKVADTVEEIKVIDAEKNLNIKDNTSKETVVKAHFTLENNDNSEEKIIPVDNKKIDAKELKSEVIEVEEISMVETDTNTKQDEVVVLVKDNNDKSKKSINKSKNKKPVKSEEKKANSIKTRRIILGATFVILAVIGLFSIIGSTVNIGKKVFDNSEEKQKYANLVTMLVMYDILPFEGPSNADQTVLLTTSVWNAIVNEDMTQYETDAYMQTYLPAVDVDKYYTRIFGTNSKLTHQTFEDQGLVFEFDEEKQAYIIQATNYPSGFTPQVEKIKTSLSRKEKVVTVAYLSPQTSWGDTSERTVSKYMDYVFEKQNGQYCLVAVRESEMKVTEAVLASTSVAK